MEDHYKHRQVTSKILQYHQNRCACVEQHVSCWVPNEVDGNHFGCYTMLSTVELNSIVNNISTM